MILHVFCDWGLLGRSWALLGHSWGTLVASWDALGPLLAGLGALLGRSWRVLGRFWGHLGASWRHLEENIKKTSRGIYFWRQFWEPKWRPKSSKIVLKKQCAFHDAILTLFVDFSRFAMSGDGDMCRANPYKTLAGRTKIEVRLGLAHKIAFAKWSGQCYILEAKKTSK